jgi:flagellar protein FlbD
MMKLTRLDHRTVAINPDHVAWVEANPDTTLCLYGDRKIIVRESLDEVIDLFTEAQKRMGRGAIRLPEQITPGSSMRPGTSIRPAPLSIRPNVGSIRPNSARPSGLGDDK